MICILILPENRKKDEKNAFFSEHTKACSKKMMGYYIFLHSVKSSMRSTMRNCQDLFEVASIIFTHNWNNNAQLETLHQVVQKKKINFPVLHEFQCLF